MIHGRENFGGDTEAYNAFIESTNGLAPVMEE
jgi:hypothetical protein